MSTPLHELIFARLYMIVRTSENGNNVGDFSVFDDQIEAHNYAEERSAWYDDAIYHVFDIFDNKWLGRWVNGEGYYN